MIYSVISLRGCWHHTLLTWHNMQISDDREYEALIGEGIDSPYTTLFMFPTFESAPSALTYEFHGECSVNNYHDQLQSAWHGTRPDIIQAIAEQAYLVYSESIHQVSSVS
jgi:hypothetical protein